MADAVGSRRHRGVEIGGVDDVGLWEPAAVVGQLRARLYQPDEGGEQSASLTDRTGNRFVLRLMHT